jgi:hypothetical protein
MEDLDKTPLEAAQKEVIHIEGRSIRDYRMDEKDHIRK